MAKTSVSKKSNPEKPSLEKKVDQILSIVKRHDQKFDAIDQKFDAIDKRFDKIDRRFDRIEGHFAFYVTKEEFSEFLEREYNFQDFVIKKLDTLTVEMASTHLALRRHDDRFEKLETVAGMTK